MIQTGIKNEKAVLVDGTNTADKMGSGLLPVFSTPSMIALMEGTAAESVESELDDGETTVGIKLDISHLAPTPVGMKVRCESELTAAEGKKLTFSVKAYDESGLIGEGLHERFIVNKEKFMIKAQSKLTK